MSASPNRVTSQRTVSRLLPAAASTSIEEYMGSLGLRRTLDATGPRMLVNMVATADGRATLEGRTAGLGNWADRELFHALRAEADAVMAGAGTIREERYGRIIRDPATRERRREAGLAEEPLAVVVSSSLNLTPDLPLLAAPEARVVVVTNSSAELPPCPAAVEYVRTPGERVDLAAAVGELRARFGADLVLCEGGPRLNSDLLAAGLIDELFLSVAPNLAGGEEALRIVHGADLSPPVELELASALESESHLLLRYRVSSR